MIQITDRIAINESEIQLDYVQASGPGGQNVNKVASAVQLRFNLRASPALPQEVRTRLEKLAGSHLTEEGVLVIHARRYRTQEQNRQDALARLVALIRKAAEPPRPRFATRPTPASRHKRLQAKRRRSQLKQLRRPVSPDE
jgi:ribosome-associated protein